LNKSNALEDEVLALNRRRSSKKQKSCASGQTMAKALEDLLPESFGKPPVKAQTPDLGSARL